MTDINENQHHSRPSRFTLLIAVGVFFSSIAKPGLRVTLALVAGLMSLCSGAANAAEALSPAAQRGLTFVRANCASCHSVSKVGGSPLAIAPPFRNLHLNYPIENLEEAVRAHGRLARHQQLVQVVALAHTPLGFLRYGVM